MSHRRFRTSRVGLSLVVAAAGCLTATTADARGPRPGAGGGFGTPQGPIFMTLDAMAGGIEYVLERTVLPARRRSASCDEGGCDDACDRLTPHHLPRHGFGGPQAQGGLGQVAPRPHTHLHGDQPQHPGMQHPGMHRSGAQPLQHPGSFDEYQPLHSQPLHMQPVHPQPAARQPGYGGHAVPRGLPRVPSDHAAPPMSSEEGWIESFSPTELPPRRGAQRGQSIQPDEQYDTMPNPFLDDPQGGR